MKKALFLLFLFSLSSCSFNQGGGALIENAFTDIQYRKDGFFIQAPQKDFLYSRKRNREVLTIEDERLNHMILIDQGCDQKVDELVLNKKTRYLRGADTSRALFQKADQIFQKYRGYLGVEKAKKTWKKLTPLDISGHNGLGNI